MSVSFLTMAEPPTTAGVLLSGALLPWRRLTIVSMEVNLDLRLTYAEVYPVLATSVKWCVAETPRTAPPRPPRSRSANRSGHATEGT